jgi:molybdenum cofactor biosynthesis MoaF-like protein
MGTNFPGVGHKYLVDFSAFRVELAFTSLTSLTYTGIAADGQRGSSETVAIRIEPIADDIFLVTWQESDKTTVVHVEDFSKKTITTNITNPDLTFDQFHGSFVEAPNGAVTAPSFASDIKPMFSMGQIICMRNKGVHLDDFVYMSDSSGDGAFPDHAKARHVFARLRGDPPGQRMPPGGPFFTQAMLDKFEAWMNGGFAS